MSEWNRVKIGDVVVLVTKGATPTKLGGFVSNGINFIKSEAVDQCGRIDKSTFVFISSETHEKMKRSQLKKDDILFSMAGVYLGKTALVPEDVLPANTNQALAIIRLDQEKALPRFIYYFFRQSAVIDLVNNISGQSAQPNINFEEIKSIDLNLPPLPEQKAIAEVLTSLDDKIDLLHKQNKTLEQLAETLFRHHFIDNAQDDWEGKNLLDLIKIVGGGTPKTSVPNFWDGEINWLSGGDIASNHKSFISSSEKTITQDGLKSSSAKLLPKFATIISARGTVGKFALLSKPMSFSQSNYGILPQVKDCFFFTYLLINHAVSELQSSAYGSVFDTITTNTFKEVSISVPKDECIEEFERNISSYFFKKLACVEQIQVLQKTRERLLPKLMSGEIKLKDNILKNREVMR